MRSIADRIDRLPMTPFMWKVLFITGLGWLFDAMDQGMVSGVLASIGQEWQLSTVQLSMLGSAGILGMAVGAALSGKLSDRWGRRTVIVSTLLIFSVGSALCSFSNSYEMLLVFRFITGLGLGGELPAATTLISELSPLKKRGRNVIILESFWAWGWIAAAFVAYLAIPLYGWRVAFLVGAAPALFAALLRFGLPESPRYLVERGRVEEAEAIVSRMELSAGDSGVTEESHRDNPSSENNNSFVAGKASTFRDLWSSAHRRSTFVLWVLWFGINLGYYGFVLWTPSFLVAQGFDLVKSFEFTLIMCLAQLPGYLAAAILVERIGRKPVLVVFLLGTALAAWFFGQATDPTQILAAGCFLYFFALGAWGCVYSYTPELYPTSIRGLGVGWAAAFGRIGALIAPFIVPVLYGAFGEQAGFTFVFAMLTGVFVVVALVIAVAGKETKGVTIS